MGICTDALFTKTQQRVLSILFGQPNRSRRVGNQKHYQANHDNPIFPELRGIVMKTFGVADVLRAALQPLLSTIEVAFVYGSLAKGQDMRAAILI